MDPIGLLDSWYLTKPTYHTVAEARYAAKHGISAALSAPSSHRSYGSVIYKESSTLHKFYGLIGMKPTYWFTRPNPHGADNGFTDVGRGGIWGAVPASKIEGAEAIVLGFKRPDIGELDYDAIKKNAQTLSDLTGLPVHVFLPGSEEFVVEPEC